METDEQQIRELVATWMEATRNGDVERVLDLVTDDVVFLVPGRAPMRKADFEATARMQTGAAAPRVDGTSDVLEVQVAGDWAYMWTRLAVTVSPAEGRPTTRSGHTLSVLRRDGGRWRLARDANLLGPAEG